MSNRQGGGRVVPYINILKAFNYLFTEATKAYDILWMIGDDFCYYTIQQHFKEAKIDRGQKHALYAFNTFEVTEFVSSKYKSLNCSVAGRLLNNLLYAFNTCKTNLPKVIVMLPDDDIAKNIRSSQTHAEELKVITSWLIKEVQKAIHIFKEQLPDKVRQHNYPHVLWLCPPTHKFFSSANNKKCTNQTLCLEKLVKLHDNMSALRIIKSWSHDDSNLFLYDSYRFTSEGLCKYWMGVDVAIHFWNIAVAPKFDKLSKNVGKNTASGSKNRYQWTAKR